MKRQSESQYLNIFYYFSIFNRYKKWILALSAVGLIIGFLTSLRTPQMYSARVTILLSGDSEISATLSSYGIPVLSRGGGSKDMIIALLQSARVRRAINERFKLGERPPINLSLNTYEITAGMAIEAVCTDPTLAVQIANFCVESLDILNEELKLATQRPLVKVLDPATGSYPLDKGTKRKVFGGAFLYFLISYSIAFLKEYLTQHK